MANSTSPVPQVVEGTNAVGKINEVLDMASQAMIGGRNAATTSLLTWGYIGGRISSVDKASGTVSLTASTTNYVVMAKSGLAVSVSTATTNWNDSTNYWRLYSVVTSGTAATTWNDERFGSAGLFGVGGAGGGAVSSVNTQTGAVVLDAGDIGITDTGAYFTGTDVETALQEIGAAGATAPTQSIIVACSDEATALTTGAAKVTFRAPFAFTLSAVRASVTTAPTGSVLTIDINEGGVSILSTKITIDATEKTSTTAAAAPVISDTALADDAEITIDIDTVGSTIAGAGLKVSLIGTKT